MGVSIYRLDNGLTVYLTENHQTPRFYAEIVVRAGHKQDPPENTGLAHYLEHLLFKGNARIGTTDYQREKAHLDRITDLYEERFNETDPVRRAELYNQINAETQAGATYAIPNDFGNVYKQLGASGLNAHTWYEETVYKVGLPANRLEQWCRMESDRFIDPVFRLFATELEVVYEEKNRALDDKGRITREAMFDALFKAHPYGQQTTLGDVEHLKNPSLKAVRTYYDTYYVPNNMAIIISGSIDRDKTIALIDEHFSRWQARELPEPRVYQELPLEGREEVALDYEAEPYMLMGYRIAGRNHEDAEALMMADMVLSNRATGMIDLNMVQNHKVQSAGSTPTLQNDYGWQVFWATPTEEQTLEEAEALLQEQIERVKQGDFDEQMLGGIIAVFKKHLKRSMETDTERVAIIRNSFVAGQDWSYTVGQLERMSRLTKEDVVRVANKYYSGGYVVAYRMYGQHEVPEITKPPLDMIAIDPTKRSAYAEQILAMQVEPVEPTYIVDGEDYTVTTYAPGVELIHTPNPINDLFSLSFVIDKGMRHDKRLGMAARLFNQAGSGSLDAEGMKKAWFTLGTEVSINASPNRTVIKISGLDENFEASLALLMQGLRDPVAESQVLDDMVENVIARRQQNKESHQILAHAIRELSRYGEQSMYIDTLSDEALRAMTVERLLAEVTTLLDTKHTIRYTGSLPRQRVVSALRSHHPVGNELKDPPAPILREMRVPDQNEVRFHHKQMAQSLVYVDQPGVYYDEALMPLPELFNRYFRGMGGVAYQELREARALAYVVDGAYDTASRLGERNNTVGMIGCQADKTIDATVGMVGLFDGMPFSEDHFTKAKASLISSYRTSKIGFRSVAPAVDAWSKLGLNGDPRPGRFHILGDTNIAALKEFYNNEIKGKPMYITIVGDREKIDIEKLGNIGEVVEVELDALFGY